MPKLKESSHRPPKKRSLLHGLPRYALSVRQPYAQLLLSPSAKNPDLPVKWCENRTWEPPEEMVGERILIHAAGTPPNIEDSQTAREELARHQIAHGSFRRSAIIGSVLLLSVIKIPDNLKFHAKIDPDWLQACGIVKTFYNRTPKHGQEYFNHYPGMYWWLVSEPKLLKKPIPCAGRLNLWRPSDYIER